MRLIVFGQELDQQKHQQYPSNSRGSVPCLMFGEVKLMLGRLAGAIAACEQQGLTSRSDSLSTGWKVLYTFGDNTVVRLQLLLQEAVPRYGRPHR